MNNVFLSDSCLVQFSRLYEKKKKSAVWLITKLFYYVINNVMSKTKHNIWGCLSCEISWNLEENVMSVIQNFVDVIQNVVNVIKNVIKLHRKVHCYLHYWWHKQLNPILRAFRFKNSFAKEKGHHNEFHVWIKGSH